MNEIISKNNLSFEYRNKFNLHNKRASLSIQTRKDLEPPSISNITSQKGEFLPYLKLNASIRNGGTIKNSTQRTISISSLEMRDITYPITATYAVKSCFSYLTQYEQSEVLDYSLIYYLGQLDKKNLNNFSDLNFGFDDDKGNYIIIIGDHLTYRYEILEILGKGSFGQVCRCFDHKNRQMCAIKIIKNKRRFHKQAAIEIKILRYINTHDYDNNTNSVHLLEHFTFRKHLCLKFELLYMNLYELARVHNYSGMPLALIRNFALQIANCLMFLKKHAIIHCDLKPENILMANTQGTGLKVIDFGSACFTDERLYTYIQSRFYRAPEVILGAPYSCSIDVWSFGLILAELYLGYPLFPGENEQEQLMYIAEYLGNPPNEVLATCYRYNEFFDELGQISNIVNSKGKIRYPGSKNLNDKIKCSDKKFINLIECKRYLGCLQWDPKYRITPEDILSHTWITGKRSKHQYNVL